VIKKLAGKHEKVREPWAILLIGDHPRQRSTGPLGEQERLTRRNVEDSGSAGGRGRYRGLLDTLTQDRRVLIKPWNIGDRTQREPPGCNYINFRMKCQNAG